MMSYLQRDLFVETKTVSGPVIVTLSTLQNWNWFRKSGKICIDVTLVTVHIAVAAQVDPSN